MVKNLPAISCNAGDPALISGSGRSTGEGIGYPLQYSWASLHLQCGKPGFNSWVGKIPWRRERLLTPVFWPGEFHGLYRPWGGKESDMTEWLSFSFSLKKSYDKPRQHIKKQRYYFADNSPSSQNYGFSRSHAMMGELDHKEHWMAKNWCFWTVVLEKTLESPLDCNEIKPVKSLSYTHTYSKTHPFKCIIWWVFINAFV